MPPSEPADLNLELHVCLFVCFSSLFILSNETVNIWSHLLGFLPLHAGIYDMTSVLPSASASREDFVICSICLFCFQVSLISQALLLIKRTLVPQAWAGGCTPHPPLAAKRPKAACKLALFDFLIESKVCFSESVFEIHEVLKIEKTSFSFFFFLSTHLCYKINPEIEISHCVLFANWSRTLLLSRF